jgi:hypothetical protein
MPVNTTYSSSGAVLSEGWSSITTSTGNLITLARALQNFTNVTLTNAEQASLQAMITAVSRAIKRYCRRDFVITTYDEQYNGSGDRRLVLRQIPIISITRVSYGPYAVLRIWNSSGSNVRAVAALDSSGLALTSVAGGVTSVVRSVTWSTCLTIQQAADAVNALGNGWTAAVLSSYANWPTSDFSYPQGGINCANGTYAEFKLHVIDMSDFQVDANRGWLVRGINALVTQWDDPLNIWTPGIQNYRVVYTAGYPIIPEDIQEACAEWCAALFWQTKQNPAACPFTPPPSVAFILDHYRQHHPMPI